ncbi:MAG: helicase-exonuclease AddAB subunit AddB [Bacillota bacterium]
MSLRFILGRAGSGKTAMCLEGIRDALREDPQGPPVILLVPEQATFQMEHALVSTPDLAGFERVQVLSFKRLAGRVLLELGGGARQQIGELGKLMVLRSLVQGRAGVLKLFGATSKKYGFVTCLAAAMRELRIYDIGSDALEAAAGGLEREGQGETPLALKLHDLAVITRAYQDYLGDRYQDPDDYLKLASERIAFSQLARGATVWVDGFRGFTPQEYLVLAALLVATDRINVALCLDPGEIAHPLRDSDLFHPTRETYEKVSALARERGVEIEAPVILECCCAGGGVPPRSPALSHLERELASRPPRPFDGEVHGLRLVAAVNPRAEVEAAAQEILKLCREERMRFRDVGVIVPELETYHDLIQPIFKDYGIPCFIDRRRPVAHHPLVELIRSAMEVVSEDWTYDPVFRYLKTDLVPIDRQEVDLLENFVLAHGIRGSRWTCGNPWTYRRSFSLEEDAPPRPEDEAMLEAINDARARATRALAAFGEKVAGAGKRVRDMAGALFALLCELGVRERLEEWRTEAATSGDLEAAREHEQVWNAVVNLLDEMVEALGDKEMGLDEFIEVVEAGLEGLTLGLIPPAIDQTIVGSVERSRHPSLRAAFVLGATYDAFPRRVPEDTIFSDRERDDLGRLGLALAPNSRLDQLHEQFNVYTALTRAREYLWVSYPLADGEGRAQRPSMVIGQLKALFPALCEEFATGDPPSSGEAALDAITSETKAAATLVRRFRASLGQDSVDPFWLDLYQWLVEDADRRERAGFVLGSLKFANQTGPLSRSAASDLYSNPLRTSVSRLERFASCPFAHFACDALGLSEREIYRLAPPGMGTFVHAALHELFETLGDDRKLAAMTGDDIRAAVAEVVEALAPRLQSEILLSSARYRYIVRVLQRTLENAARVLAEHAKRSEFHPAGYEIFFGGPGGLPALRLGLDGARSVELVGRIDRVDVARAESGQYLRVIDYKSSRPKLKLSDVYHGLALQLLVYLAVATQYARRLAGHPAEPAGALYFPVVDPIISATGPVDDATIEKERKRQARMSGIVVGDADVVRLMDSQVNKGSDIIPAGITKDGEVARTPGTGVIERKKYDTLSRFLLRKIKDLASRIVSGEVAARPYRRGRFRACQLCSYKPVCGFDVLLPGNEYRSITDMKDDEFWALVEDEVSRED